MKRRRPFLLLLLLIPIGVLPLVWSAMSVDTGDPVAPMREVTVPIVPQPVADPEVAGDPIGVRPPVVSEPDTPDAQAPSTEPAAPVPYGPGGLAVTVHDTSGALVTNAGVVTTGECGENNFSVADGSAEVLLPPGFCELVAYREDGALQARSPATAVRIIPSQTIRASLTVPSERRGGLGVRIRRRGEGILVDEVVDGTPAAEAGLEAGDYIVAIDGVSVEGMSLTDFQGRMTGPVGTQVRFTLAYEGESGPVQEQITITRAFLDG